MIRPLARPLTRPFLGALLASSALLPAPLLAQSLPTDGRVVRGEASIHTAAPDAMTIRQASDRAVIDWSSFSLAKGARLDIWQNDARSALLNRVTGDTTSTIAGQITANGQVFLVNPNGILITPSGSVKAAGFVASTLDLSNDAFMAGDITVTGRGGRVTNAGTIDIVKGGYAALIGGRVENSGTILAPLGRVAIGSASRATLDLEGDGFLQVALPAAGTDAGVHMPGRIVADGGAVLLSAGAARDAARGVVNMTGSIEAKGLAGHSGAITLTGGDITLAGASIDASGETGGGQVRIGGDWRGGGTLTRAKTLTVDAATVIRADATGTGNGGRVVLWSDAATRFAGTISARGAGSGKGGDAEVSGKAWLSYTGATDLRGAGGFGTLLLDPYNVTITNATQTTGSGFTATSDDSIINITTLQNALATASVTVSTGTGGNQAGGIVLADPIAWSSGSTLTLSAAGGIVLNGSVTANTGALRIDAGDMINTGATGAISVGRFILERGDWRQVGANLPAFTARDFRLSGGTFVRALGGAGSASNPGRLIDIYGLQGMATLLGSHYVLANDIDASGTKDWNDGAGFVPVGSNNASFSGSLDGAGHVVSGLTIDRAGSDHVGLIGFLSGSIGNIGMDGRLIRGAGAVGGLVGWNDRSGTVRNAYANGAVSGTASVGGLVGYNSGGAVSNVYATSGVSGTGNVGGLVGYNDGGVVSNAYATGAVIGLSVVGGLVGHNDGGTVSNSYWDMVTTGQATSAGGTGLTTSQARNAANYTGFDFANTWFQTGDMRPILRSELQKGADGIYRIGNLHQLQLMAADLAGTYLLTRDIDASATHGTDAAGIWGTGGFVPVGSNGAGLTGSLDGAGHVVSKLAIDRPSTDDVGLFGYLQSGARVTRIGLTGVSVVGRSGVGGLVGGGNNATISNSYVVGTIRGGGNGVGGLVGDLALGSITDAYAAGSVSGYFFVGGLIGRDSANLSNVYAAAAVVGSGRVGGLVGLKMDGTVANAYAAGAVQGINDVGGLVGFLSEGTVTASYWDTQTTGQSSSSGGGTGLTTGQFQAGGATALGAAFAGGANGIYPYLRALRPNGVQAISGIAGGTDVRGGLVTLYQGGRVLGTASVGANGYYYVAADAGTLVGGAVLGYTATARGATMAGGIKYDDGLRLDGNGNLSGQSLSLGTRSYGTSARSWSALTAGMAETFGGSTYAALDTALSGATLFLVALGDFTLDRVLSLGGSNARLTVQGDLRIANGVSLSGHDLDLSLSGKFLNDGGANALSATGRWLVRSMDPGADRSGGLTPSFIQYSATPGTPVAQASGNGFLYRFAPMVTVGLTGVAERVYDGTNVATLADGNFSLSGQQPGDRITLTRGGATFATRNIGSGLQVTATGLALGDAFTADGVRVYGYQLASTQASGVIGTITPATLTYIAQTSSRRYGFADTGLGGNVTGFVPGDTLANATTGTLTWTSAASQGSNVGNYAINGAGLSANNGNYVVAQAAGNATALTVTPRALTVTADALARKYGYANPALTWVLGGDGLYGSDVLSGALATGAVEDSDVGRYTIGQGSLTAGSNYTIAFTGADLTVTPRSLTVTADALTRKYGYVNPALTWVLGGDGLYGSDTLTGALATTATEGSNVGRYAIGQASLIAGDNYAISYTGAELTITPRALTVTADALTRKYGYANPALTWVLGGDGLYGRDALSGALATTATEGSDVGRYAIGQDSLTAGGNYTISYTGAELAVTPRALTVAADALTRKYGYANPALTWVLGGDGLYGSDVLSGALATGAVEDSDVGRYTIGQGSLTAGSNYTIAFTGADLTVTPRSLTVTADALTRKYGYVNPALTWVLGGDGLYGSDTLTGALATTATEGSNVGRYAIGQASLIAGDNYAISYTGAELTITPRALTVTADALTRKYGYANPALTWVLGGDGLYGRDALSGALATTATEGSDVGRYAIGQGSLTAGGNYAIAFTGAELSVTPRVLSVDADAASRKYGYANPALTYLLGGDGLYGSDALAGALATDAVIGSDVGRYAIGQGNLIAGDNYAISYTGAELTITPRALTVTADALTRKYGYANPALTWVLGGDGLYGRDALSGALATAATEGSNVGRYAIGQGSLTAGGNYAIAFTGAELAVTPRALTVTADALARKYGYANPALSWVLGGDGLYSSDALTGALATAATEGSDVGRYAIGRGSLTAGGNYAIAFTGAELSVTPRVLSVDADAASRKYGYANPALTYLLGGDGLYGSDALTGALATSATEGSNVGRYAIGQGSLTAGGNYAIAFTGAELTVTPRALTVAADALTRKYGYANPALTWVLGGDGLYGSDALAGALATDAVIGSDVGRYAIGQGNLIAGDNYAISYTGAELTITPRALTVTADALTRKYGYANPALTWVLGGDGLYGRDALSGALATSATEGSNVGRYAIGQGSLTAGGNYAITYTGADLTVTPRALTVAADALARKYGYANPALTWVLGGDGLYSSDALSGALVTTATEGSDVGRYAIGQGTLSAGSNYAIAFTGADLVVTARDLTVTVDALTRKYGYANPALTWVLGGDGLYGRDALSGALATTATEGSDVGRYAIGQGTLSAGDNYTISYTGAELAVTPRALTVAADALTRKYGYANPALTWVLDADGLYGRDALSGALATSATEGSEVGRYAIGQGSLTAGGNYAIAFTGADLIVTPRDLTVTADALTRKYGYANPALTWVLGGDGLYGRDALAGALATSATEGSNVGRYAIGQGSLTAGGNYAIAYTGADLTVTPRALTVTADALTRKYGYANPALTYVLSGDGLYGSDALSGALTTTATEGSDVGRYAIGQGSLSAGGNYAIAYTGAELAVTPRALTVTADALARKYGYANPALTWVLGGDGLYGSDAITGALATDAVIGSNVGRYAIGQGDLSAGSNYAIAYTGAELAITPRALTVAADSASRKYGYANPGLTYLLGGDGLYGSDALTGALTTTATEGSEVGRYAIGQGSLTAGGNYTIGYTGAELAVTPRALSVVADALTRKYGNANPALTYTIGGDGLYGRDGLTGVLKTDADARSGVGSYAISQGGLSASGNYTVRYVGASLSITPRAITVSAVPLARWYGYANPPLTWTISGMGLVNGDSLTGMLAADADQTSLPGIYAIHQGSLRASIDYAVTFVPGELTIRYADPLLAQPVSASAVLRDWWRPLKIEPAYLPVTTGLPVITRDTVRLP